MHNFQFMAIRMQVTGGIENNSGSRVGVSACCLPLSPGLFLVDCNLTISFHIPIIFNNCIDLLRCSSGVPSFAIEKLFLRRVPLAPSNRA